MSSVVKLSWPGPSEPKLRFIKQSIILECVDLLNEEAFYDDEEALCDQTYSTVNYLLGRSIGELDPMAVGKVLIKLPRWRLWGNADSRNILFARCLNWFFCRPVNRDEEKADSEFVWADVASDKSIAVLELILAAGADPRYVDSRGLSCLHWLAQRSGDASDLEKFMSILVKAGCNVEARDGTYGASALAWAAYQGCDSPPPPKIQQTPTTFFFYRCGSTLNAAPARRVGAVQALLAVGADRESRDDYGQVRHRP
jgi:hypothetical protein